MFTKDLNSAVLVQRFYIIFALLKKLQSLKSKVYPEE